MSSELLKTLFEFRADIITKLSLGTEERFTLDSSKEIQQQNAQAKSLALVEINLTSDVAQIQNILNKLAENLTQNNQAIIQAASNISVSNTSDQSIQLTSSIKLGFR